MQQGGDLLAATLRPLANGKDYALRAQLTAFGVPENERPMIAGWDDPYDYLSPGLATFDWKDTRWREVPAGKAGVKCEGSSDSD